MRDCTEEIVSLMLTTRHGQGYRHISKSVLSAFVRYEWDSQRWEMIVDPETQQINGWISWYRLDDSSLEQIGKHGVVGCFERDIPLHSGNNLYLCNAVVRDGAPVGTFWLLVSMAKAANPYTKTISAHLRNRSNKPCRWSSFERMGS